MSQSRRVFARLLCGRCYPGSLVAGQSSCIVRVHRCGTIENLHRRKRTDMTQTVIQRSFAPLKKYLPGWLSNSIRSLVTAFLTPALFSYQTGHFLSSFKMAAVSKDGKPLPWYTYPSIDFLRYRTYEDKDVLEFGGGQSTLWWAQRARRVLTLEGDPAWYEKLKEKIPDNVSLHLTSLKNRETNISQVREILALNPGSKYDVIIIDGLYRYEMIDIACGVLAEGGMIVCDNAEGYGFFEGFKDRGMSRVDFYGHAPGTVLPYSTSIYFLSHSFAFDAAIPIQVIAQEK
jgi:hypothetical protein